jgi:hypothetical protein
MTEEVKDGEISLGTSLACFREKWRRVVAEVAKTFGGHNYAGRTMVGTSQTGRNSGEFRYVHATRTPSRGEKLCYALSSRFRYHPRCHAGITQNDEFIRTAFRASCPGFGCLLCSGRGYSSDFLAWGVDQLMAHLDVDGLYIDNPGRLRFPLSTARIDGPDNRRLPNYNTRSAVPAVATSTKPPPIAPSQQKET